MLSSAVDGYFLPQVGPGRMNTSSQVIENSFGEIELRIPDLLPGDIDTVTAALRDSRRILRDRETNDLRGSLAKLLRMWLDPHYESRKLAEIMLPITLGYSREMVKSMLDGMFGKLLSDVGELGSPHVGDRELLVAIYPDIPGPQVIAVIKGLLSGMAVLCKAPSREPVFTALFAASIGDIDERLQRCVAAIPWEGGSNRSEPLESYVYGGLTGKDAIVAFGSPEVAEQIDGKKREDVPLISFTRGMGFIILGKGALLQATAESTIRTCARLVSMYNSDACVSPQVIAVESGGDIEPQRFADLLSSALTEVALDELPVGDFSGDSYARFAQAHRTYRLQQIRGILSYYTVFDPQQRPVGGVVYLSSGGFELPKSRHRVVVVTPVDQISDAVVLIEDRAEQIHTIGLGINKDRWSEGISMFEGMGIRVSRVEDMLDLSFQDYQFP